MRCVIIELFDSLELRSLWPAWEKPKKRPQWHMLRGRRYLNSCARRIIGPNSFVFWIFVSKCYFIQLFCVLCCRFFSSFSIVFEHIRWFFSSFFFILLFVRLCLSCSSFSFVYFFFSRLFFRKLNAQTKWFLLMKLELLFHLAVVRSTVQLRAI